MSRPSHTASFDHPNNNQVKITHYKALNSVIFSILLLPFLSFKYPPQSLVLRYPKSVTDKIVDLNLISFLAVRSRTMRTAVSACPHLNF